MKSSTAFRNLPTRNRTCAVAALLSVLASNSVYSQTPLLLQDGTAVRMRLSRNLSSASAREGETVDFEVLDEVRVGDIIVIPQGASAMATVTDARSKRSMGRAGHLNVNVDYVRSASGEKIALKGVQDAKAGGHVGAMTGAIVATSIVFFPAAPLFLFMKGKDITIPKGHEVTVYVASDFKVDATKYKQVAAPPSPTPTSSLNGVKPLSNDDIISLKGAGFSDELLIAKIKNSPTNFKMDTVDLLALKKAGLGDAVLGAMVAGGLH